jgi:phosphoglycolate phosphatase-like HAD superfamily hydrolase
VTDHVTEAARVLTDFQPTHEFFVGIDSDGCAMDAMDIKHQECFTPTTIKHWKLQAASTLARETCLFVNLHSKNRGLNRWIALLRVFDLLRERPEVAERGVTVPEGKELRAFIESGYPLSDLGIREFAAEHPGPEIENCIRWGDGVNASIADMVHGCPPFPGVRAALEAMQDNVDCMVVSATPLHALEYEWHAHDIARYTKMIAGQEMGSKAQHIEFAAKGKYPEDRIMLIGDAPGDLAAATTTGVRYYPINPGKEAASWRRFTAEALPRFLDGAYAGEYEQAVIAEFDALLPERPPWVS